MKSFFNDFDTCVYDKKMIRMLLAMQLPHTQKKHRKQDLFTYL